MTKFYSFDRPVWMAAMVAIVFFAGYAGVEAGPLATTDSAFFGVINNEDGLQNGHDGGYWRGSETLVGSFGFTSTVDFAVFAPGPSFGDFLGDDNYPGEGLTDPTSGFEWVYAFQTTGGDAPFGDFVSRLNAGYDPDEIVTGPAGSGPGFPPGEVAIAGGVGTSSSLLQGSSSSWLWEPAGLGIGLNSNILYYTSAFAPKKDKVTVLSAFDQKTSGFQDFASPSNVIHDFEIPEPTSLTLAASLFTILVSGRRRKLQSTT